MKAYRFFPDGVFDCEVELEGPALRPFHTDEAPPVQEGFYAVMNGGWTLIAGEKPTRQVLTFIKPDTVREQRDKLLSESVDRINSIWWESMTDEQKAAWRTYRQALLDITEQGSDIDTITWPKKP